MISALRAERYLIVRGVDHLLEQEWSMNGSSVSPSSVFITVRNASGADVVARVAASVAQDVASYQVDAAVTQGLRLEQGWVVIWEAVLPGSATPREFVAEAALVRYVIAPPCGVADLYARQARLSPSHRSPLTSDLDLGAKLDEAWKDIERRLYTHGRRPELVMSPAQFRTPHQTRALQLVFEDLRTSNWESYSTIAEDYRQEFDRVWRELVFSYDSNQVGKPDGGASPEREGAQGSIWLSSRGGGG